MRRLMVMLLMSISICVSTKVSFNLSKTYNLPLLKDNSPGSRFCFQTSLPFELKLRLHRCKEAIGKCAIIKIVPLTTYLVRRYPFSRVVSTRALCYSSIALYIPM